MYNIFYTQQCGPLQKHTTNNLQQAIALHDKLIAQGYDVITERPH